MKKLTNCFRARSLFVMNFLVRIVTAFVSAIIKQPQREGRMEPVHSRSDGEDLRKRREGFASAPANNISNSAIKENETLPKP